MNGLFVNEDLNFEWTIDLQISSHKNKGYEQNLTHRKIGPHQWKVSLNYISYLLRNGREMYFSTNQGQSIKEKLSNQNK